MMINRRLEDIKYIIIMDCSEIRGRGADCCISPAIMEELLYTLIFIIPYQNENENNPNKYIIWQSLTGP